MWVNKEEWRKLNARIKELETRMTSATEYDHFTVYMEGDEETANWRKYGFFLNYMPAKDFISVKEVVSKILAHLGMRLVYTKGTPGEVSMKPEPKKK